MIAQYLTVLLYFGLISLCIELASPRVSSLVILVGVIYPIYLLFLLSAELFASESVRVDRYAVEVERTLLGFSVGDEVFKTESIRNVRVGAIRTWSSKRGAYSGGRILFNEGDDTFSLGAVLSDETAAEIAFAIRDRIEQFAKTG
jgi:hypothetical protein